MIKAKFDKARRVLILTADNESRAELADANRSGGYYAMQAIVAEALHEVYEWIDADDIPGALTSAPFLVDCDGLAHPDNGEVVFYPDAVGFWFPDYCVINEMDELKNKGRVVFNQAFGFEDCEPPPSLPANLDDYLTGGAKEGELFYVGEGVTLGVFPELESADPYRLREGDAAIPGLYFIRKGRAFGPYGQTFKGANAAAQRGATPWYEVDERQRKANEAAKAQGDLFA